MDSVSERPLQGRVDPVVMAAPTAGRKGQWACEDEDGMQRHGYLYSVNSTEEKRTPFITTGVKKSPLSKMENSHLL